MPGLLPVTAVLAAAAFMAVTGSIMFGSRAMGMSTAAVFLSAPLLWNQVRAPGPALDALPFVAAWLTAVALSESGRSVRALAVAGACLGAGLYTSNAATVMMPVFAAVTVAAMLAGSAASARSHAMFVAAFVITGLPLVAWFVRHTDQFRAAVNAAHLYDANRFNILQGLREMTSWVGLTARTDVYHSYFDPAFLFLGGEVLLAPLIVLVPAGLLRVIDYPSVVARVALGGCLAAPMAAAMTAQSPSPPRIVFITPFASLLAMYGVQQMIEWAHAFRNKRAAAARTTR